MRDIYTREEREALLDSIFNESCIDTMKRIPDNFVDVRIRNKWLLSAPKAYSESIKKQWFQNT